jgi:hypothetical protein
VLSINFLTVTILKSHGYKNASSSSSKMSVRHAQNRLIHTQEALISTQPTTLLNIIMMKNFILSLLFSTLATAAPLEARQNTGITENEFTRYGCRDVLFFFARGSTELGNMVITTSQTYFLTAHTLSREVVLVHQHPTV